MQTVIKTAKLKGFDIVNNKKVDALKKLECRWLYIVKIDILTIKVVPIYYRVIRVVDMDQIKQNQYKSNVIKRPK